MKNSPSPILSPRGIPLNSRGAAVLEYGVLLGLVAVLSLGVVMVLGEKTKTSYTKSADAVSGGTVAAVPPAAEDCSPYATFDYYGSAVQTKLHTNVWQAQGNETLCVSHGDTAASATKPWGWTWDIPGNGTDVIAYPGVAFGQQPFMGYDPAPAATQIGSLTADLHYSYGVTPDSAGIYNVAASSWVLSSNVSRPENVIGEVMVWVENQGMTPAGTLLASGVSIDGATYDLYREPNMVDKTGTVSGGWDYFAFLRTSGAARSGTIHMRAFLNTLVSQGYFLSSDYVASVEFGSEILKGSGEIRATQLSLDGLSGYGSSDTAPAVAAFDFGTTTVAADSTDATVTSPYLDLHLGSEPRQFSVSGDDPALNPVAVSNVVGGGAASSGQVLYGTALQADMPAPGQTTVITLDVDGTTGTWTIKRAGVMDFITASDLGTVTAPTSGGATLATINLQDPATSSITLTADNGGQNYGAAIDGIGDFQLQPNGSDPLAIDLVCYWGPNCTGSHSFTINAVSDNTGAVATRSFLINVQ